MDSDLGNNNWLTGFITNLLDPQIVYEHFTYVATFGAVAPWLISIFVAVRLTQEASNGLTFKASLAQAIGQTSQTLMLFIGYSAGGLAIFGLLWVFSVIFGKYGSAGMIHGEMLQLRDLMLQDPEVERQWWEEVTEAMVNVASIGSYGLTYLVYHFVSVAYTVLSRLIDVFFAIGIAVTYAWGFIAILTRILGEKFDLTPGFIKTLLTFFIWVMLEPLLLFFVWLLSQGVVAWIENGYAGSGMDLAGMTLWHLFATAMMILVLIMKLIAPFLALSLAQNNSMVGALGAAPAAVGAMVMNQVVKKAADGMGSKGGGQGGDSSGWRPNLEGNRSRDKAFQAVDDRLNAPIGQLFGGRGSNDLTRGGGGGNNE